ncbi:MAG TPA: hypothetical protein VFA45_20215, partial [Actinomycetes bacterium]|nr:hypothetical protein [Actinomycetes bacterium]
FVKLLVREPGSPTAVQAWLGGFQMSASPLLFVETRASLAAARRARRITSNEFSAAKDRLGGPTGFELARLLASIGPARPHHPLRQAMAAAPARRLAVGGVV